MSNEPESERIPHVDEDWKDQVAREKTEAEGPPASRQETAPPAPPAGFDTLVTLLFTQAMAALGQVAGPDGKSPKVNKPLAKYFIDTVEILGEKTRGNLTETESKLLSDTLHAMRIAYVSIRAT
jgi:hypothetical protein